MKKHTTRIFSRPEMENPVYKIEISEPESFYSYFIQRIETNSYPEWHEVMKDDDGVWMTIDNKSFLGFNKKEALDMIIARHDAFRDKIALKNL